MVTNSSNRGLQIPTVGGDAGVWGNELNGSLNTLDSILGGSITFLTSVGVTVTLSTANAVYGRLVMGGIPASSMTLNFSSSICFGNYEVWNAGSTALGSFNVTGQITSTSTGSAVLIPQGNMRLVNVDGQNVQYADQVIIPVVTLPPVLANYITGLNISTGTSSMTLNFSAGMATDTTNVTYMQNAASFTKSASAAWASGSGNGGLGGGVSFNAATWYHCFIISNGVSSGIDFYYDTSVTAANKPAGTNYFRRVASMMTASSAATWQSFSQNGNEFLWVVPTHDINATTSFSTTAANVSLTVPPGVKVYARMVIYGQWLSSGGGNDVLFFPPDLGAVTIGTLGPSQLTWATGENTAVEVLVRTNTSGQVSWVAGFTSAGKAQLDLWTLGWIDTRGTDNL